MTEKLSEFITGNCPLVKNIISLIILTLLKDYNFINYYFLLYKLKIGNLIPSIISMLVSITEDTNPSPTTQIFRKGHSYIESTQKYYLDRKHNEIRKEYFVEIFPGVFTLIF